MQKKNSLNDLFQPLNNFLLPLFFLVLAVALNACSKKIFDPTEDDTSTTEISKIYPIVSTGVTHFYDDNGIMESPETGDAFYGQNANYPGNIGQYQDNGDETISDQVTGLMWQKTPDLDNKSTFTEALAGQGTFSLAGYNDWRLPTIKDPMFA